MPMAPNPAMLVCEAKAYTKSVKQWLLPRRERAFLRDYPLTEPQPDWRRREVSPSARRRIRRRWAAVRRGPRPALDSLIN